MTDQYQCFTRTNIRALTRLSPYYQWIKEITTVTTTTTTTTGNNAMRNQLSNEPIFQIMLLLVFILS